MRSETFTRTYQQKWGYSMPKKPNLVETFKVNENELQPKPKIEVVAARSPTQTATKPKKKHIGGYFSNDVYTQMKILCAEKDMTTQEILTEGLNAVFRMHDKPPIA